MRALSNNVVVGSVGVEFVVVDRCIVVVVVVVDVAVAVVVAAVVVAVAVVFAVVVVDVVVVVAGGGGSEANWGCSNTETASLRQNTRDPAVHQTYKKIRGYLYIRIIINKLVTVKTYLSCEINSYNSNYY